jgi:hypothetical protein
MSVSPRTSTPSRSASNSASRVSIADLRASGLALEWYEAAAIVQGLCRAINESHGPVTNTELALNNVFVDPEGTISIGDRPDPADALPQVRKLLCEMLPRTEVARAKILPDSSLPEFSRALEAYERADRAGVIKDVRGRWRPSSVWAFDPIVTPETTAAADGVTPDTARRRLGPRLVAVAVLVAAAGGVAVWALNQPHLSAKMRTYAAAISSDGHPAVAARVPSLPSGPPTSSRVERAVTARARPPRAEMAARPRADVPAAGAADRVARSRGLVASGGTPSAPASLTPLERPAVAPTPDAEPGALAVSTQVFDATARDVVPPSFLQSESITPRATEASPKDAAAIEVMVNEGGTIDAVKARSAPRTLAASMQMMSDLSAAKSWRFRPAMRDGRPVKYRLVVALTAR